MVWSGTAGADGAVRLGKIKGQTLWFAAQFAIMPHIQFHFNCNNFGQRQKERYQINTRMHICIYIYRYIYLDKYWEYSYIWLNSGFGRCCAIFVCVFVACFSAVKCISHFIVHSIKNPFPFAACEDSQLPTPVSRFQTRNIRLPPLSTRGTVLVYSKNMPARVSTGGRMSE